MSIDDPSGRDDDLGASTASGHDPDLSAPSSRPQADDLNVTGDGTAERTGDVDLQTDDAGRDVEHMDLPSDTPDDLRLGTRRTEGLDEETGAGASDAPGVRGSTSGGDRS